MIIVIVIIMMITIVIIMDPLKYNISRINKMLSEARARGRLLCGPSTTKVSIVYYSVYVYIYIYIHTHMYIYIYIYVYYCQGISSIHFLNYATFLHRFVRLNVAHLL